MPCVARDLSSCRKMTTAAAAIATTTAPPGGSVVMQDATEPENQMVIYRDFFGAEAAQEIMTFFRGQVGRQLAPKVGAHNRLTPRLSAVWGDRGVRYSYSRVREPTFPWPKPVLEVRDRLREEFGVSFQLVLGLWYRDGSDSVAYHGDDEKSIDPAFPIISVSFGASRAFHIRRKDDHRDRKTVMLHPGDVLVMKGPRCQQLFEHAVPKTKKPLGPRVNMTFRVFRK